MPENFWERMEEMTQDLNKEIGNESLNDVNLAEKLENSETVVQNLVLKVWNLVNEIGKKIEWGWISLEEAKNLSDLSRKWQGIIASDWMYSFIQPLWTWTKKTVEIEWEEISYMTYDFTIVDYGD